MPDTVTSRIAGLTAIHLLSHPAAVAQQVDDTEAATGAAAGNHG